MKILIVNKFLYPKGGSETYIFKLGTFLQSAGHEIQYFGMEHEGRIVGNRAESYTSNMDFHGGSKLEKLLYPVKTIYSAEARRKIRRVLDDFQPDMVHLNNFNYQLTPSIIWEIRKWEKQNDRKCKILYTAHDYQLVCPNHMCNNPVHGENCEKCLGGHFWNCARRKCIHGSAAKSIVGAMEGFFWKLMSTYRQIDTVICCSDFLKSKLDTNPVLADRTVAIHNFIDPVKQKTVEKKDYVLYFGRFSREKGIATLIEAAKNLPQISFVFAGSGPLEQQLEGIPNIRNVGFQQGEALGTLIREAKVSVYPSEWYENCPFSVLESIAYGTPVIGARMGGIPELITEGETGELFEAGNAAQLEEKLRKLLFTPGLAERYSENCRHAAFETPESYYEKLMEIYAG
jgi:glycosyltransferase involved in cell wall biosynthesis